MKIGVWSPFGGSGVTITSLSLSMKLLQLRRSSRVALFQTGYYYYDLCDYVIHGNDDSDLTGIDSLITNVSSGVTDFGTLYSCGYDLGNIGIGLYRSTTYSNKDKYYRDLNVSFNQIADALANVYEHTIIDIESKNSDTSILALGSSDVVIVCLPQNPVKIANFFKEYKDRANFSKCFYLLTDYESNGITNVDAMRRINSKYISNKNSGKLTHSSAVLNATCTGTYKALMYKYSTKNASTDRELNQFFIDLDSITAKILKMKVGKK